MLVDAPRRAQQGTQVHPADLDDALCLIAVASRGDSTGATRLPFAVDAALLEGHVGMLWATVGLQRDATANVRLATDDSKPQAQLDGFKSRELRSDALSSLQKLQRVHVTRPGALSGMILSAQPAFEASLEPGAVELQVQAVGLNFRDVLLVLGEYPGAFEPPGRYASARMHAQPARVRPWEWCAHTLHVVLPWIGIACAQRLLGLCGGGQRGD